MEKQLAMKHPRSQKLNLGCLIFSLISAGIFVYGYLQEWGWVWTGLAILSTMILIVAFFVTIGDISWRLRRPEVRRKIMEAIDHNKVEVLNFNPSAVITLFDEGKGEEIAYYYDIGNQQVLFLQFEEGADTGEGKELYLKSDIEAWPNDCFEIVRTEKRGALLGVFCNGERLKSIRNVYFDDHLPKSDEASILLDNLPDHPIAIFEGSLENLIETVKKEPIEVWEIEGWI